MSDNFSIPFLKEMIPDGYAYGGNYLIEFDSDSVWYEASLTIAAQAVKRGIKTDYHTFIHIPGEVREAFSKLGVDIKRLERENILRVIDSYTIATGLGPPETPDKSPHWRSRSLSWKDWDEHYVREIREGVPEVDMRRLHLDDNASVMVQYHGEKEFLGIWRTRLLPWTRKTQTTLLMAVIAGAFSDSFYGEIEPPSDGVIDFKSREEEGQIEQYVRVRALRGRPCDSRWRHLRVLDNGEVVIEPKPVHQVDVKERELGLSKLGAGPLDAQSIQEIGFDTERAREIFTLLAKAFVHDYMFKRLYVDRAGWRSLMQLIGESDLPRSAFYGPMGRKGPVLTELERHGLVEARIFPEERGRGGEVTKLRVTYENGLVRRLLEQVAMETTWKD